MSYAIAVFDRPSLAPRGHFYTLNGLSADNGGQFVSPDYDWIAAQASMTARAHSGSAAYAVFRVGDCADARAGRAPAAGLLASYGSPCFIPYACEGLAASLAPAALPALPLTATPMSSRPYVTACGVPCRVVEFSTLYDERTDTREDCVSVRFLSGVAGLYSSGPWSFWLRDGLFIGGENNPTYPRLVNAPGSVAAPLPEPVDDTPAPAPAPAPAAPSVRFEVRSGVNGTDRDTWGAVAEFPSGREAGAWVGANKAAYAENGKSLVIVKVELEAAAIDWRERERERLRDGSYLPLPGDWASEIDRHYPDHFAHLASSDKRKIAFTESESSGERDKQKVLSASEYAARFFGGDRSGPWWYSETRARFVADVLGSSLVPIITPLGDVAAMISAYRQCCDGPAHGCMSYSSGNFSTGGVHPVTVYAKGGELAVALLKGDRRSGDIDPDATLDGDGVPLARCLVWIKEGRNLEYGRVYGASHHARELRTALEAMGFCQGDCYGARIAKIEAPNGGYVMPYLDIGGGCVDDCGTHFEAGGDCPAQNTCGTMAGRELADCDRCGSEYDSDDGSSVMVAQRDWENWCPHCAEEHAFYCSEINETVCDSRAAELVRSNGCSDTVAEWVFDRGYIEAVQDTCGVWHENGFYCEDCEEGFGPDALNVWDGRDTGDTSHAEGACLCGDCYSERESLAEALKAEETETDAAAAA